jgi:hypothetical protein
MSGLALPEATQSSPHIVTPSPRASGDKSPRRSPRESPVNHNANNTNKLTTGELSAQNKALDLSSSASASRKAKSPENESSTYSSLSEVTLAMMVSNVFQRFLVRMPHTFIAMALTFVPLYYGMEKESLAISASTFVGVGGTVYCFARAFFFEAIPNWMIPRNVEGKLWRRVLNITYTVFMTVTFTTAVWKLPDISAAQGLAFLLATFGAPYIFIAKLYPEIDKRPFPNERITA